MVTNKSKNKSQESITDQDKPEQEDVSEKSTETEVHTPSTSSSVQAITRRFLLMTIIRVLPIRKLPEVSLNGQVS